MTYQAPGLPEVDEKMTLGMGMGVGVGIDVNATADGVPHPNEIDIRSDIDFSSTFSDLVDLNTNLNFSVTDFEALHSLCSTCT